MAPIYSTLDPSAKGYLITLTGGDLTAAHAAGSRWSHCRATLGKPISEGGKWYWEHTIDILNSAASQMHGFANADAPLGTASIHGHLGSTDDSCGIRKSGAGQEFYNGSVSEVILGAIAINYTIGHELDLAGNTYRQSVNGVWGGYVTRGFPATVAGNYSGTPDLIYPAVGFQQLQQVTANFGASPFAYTPPSGANAGWYEGEEEVAAGNINRKLGRGNARGLWRGLG